MRPEFSRTILCCRAKKGSFESKAMRLTGGPCNACLGSGRSGPTFAEAVTEGSTWTLTYTTSVPEGAAAWFPGGTVNTVYRAVAVKAK